MTAVEMSYAAARIREVCSDLWKIYHSFRILKAELLARLTYVLHPKLASC